MSPRPDPPADDTGLVELGLRPGARVRFRRDEGQRWRDAVVERRERDGSIGLRDGKGASRAIPIERIEVRTEGPRGGVVWEPLAERAARAEQMKLL